MKHKLAIAALSLAPFCAFSEEAKEEKSPYKASAELGALYKTGNGKSADILAGFDADYEKDLWRASLKFDLLIRKKEVDVKDDTGKVIDEDFATSDQKWNLALQVNHTLDTNTKNYLYGNGAYEDDKFNGFDNKWSVSAGWGRRWYETEVSTFDADFGPGFKRDVISSYSTELPDDEFEFTPSEKRDSVIVQAQMTYTRKLNEHVEFKQFAVAKWATKSGENSQFKAETSITTKLIETLQLKFSFKVDHNTDVDANKDNTLTQTGITLVYSF